MDIYFNKYGVCTTQIYNGEIVRQNSTFDIRVYFDETFDSANTKVTVKFLRPGDTNFTADYDFDEAKPDYFVKQDDHEISLDLINGKKYFVFSKKISNKLNITSYYGKLIAVVTVYKGNDVYVQSRVIINVEPTTGDAVFNTITQSEYDYLVSLYGDINSVLTNLLGESEGE